MDSSLNNAVYLQFSLSLSHTHTHTHTHTHARTHTHTHMHARTHTHTHCLIYHRMRLTHEDQLSELARRCEEDKETLKQHHMSQLKVQ